MIRFRRRSQKPQLSSSQKFELADRAFSLTSGIVGNANSNLGRPPRPPGFKKRPNTAGAQPMGGLPIEEFLAVMNGGGDSGELSASSCSWASPSRATRARQTTLLLPSPSES